jgi:hypothetical protein
VALGPTQSLIERSIRSIFWEVKAAGVDCLEIWKRQLPVKL